MPLVEGYSWYVYKYVVTGVELEVRRSLDHQVRDSGGQENTGGYVCLAAFGPAD